MLTIGHGSRVWCLAHNGVQLISESPYAKTEQHSQFILPSDMPTDLPLILLGETPFYAIDYRPLRSTWGTMDGVY